MGARLKSVTQLERNHEQRPLVGVTTSELRRKEQLSLKPQGEPGQTSLTLGLAYAEAISMAGGIPVVLTHVRPGDVAALLGRLDGIVLSGGPDLEPSVYGQPAHAELGPTEPPIDEFELSLCKAAIVAGMPVLGICRGMQLLNVACGGTLHQHLPDVAGEQIAHRHPEAELAAMHEVDITPGSTLAQIIGGAPLSVNSFHHQGVDRLARPLRACARAPDGVIEALESRDGAMLLGVQWHVEGMMEDPRHAAVLGAFIDAARAERGDQALRRLAG